MDPEKWQRVKSVLEAALELPPGEREAFLAAHCNGDGDIREEVLALLAEESDADRFEISAAEAYGFSNGHTDAEASQIGRIIGKYRITAPIGSGGMGSVFLAERADQDFDQVVAIKLIKAGLASDTVMQRFLNERQILASLVHPNIARLIDGGSTDDGSPYLVMEYVEGLPITEFAKTQGLGLEERLDLFRRVCSAVAFAHRNLVIHRDLKPSNILVTADGEPKLLDFGIAKLADPERGGDAATRQFALTPEYASPEQILGGNLTTATDLYSLGVILFELLTGRRPFSREGSVGEILRSATEPVTRPSLFVREGSGGDEGDQEFRRRLRGDLDNIILKALKEEPERRYSSVGQFADDIRRYLKGQPVSARADTFRYRARKFASRNPLVVGSAALAVLILIGGTVATAYQARRADRERVRAEHRFNDLRALANSFIFEVNDKIDESPIKARELVVTRALEYLDRLTGESGGDAGLQTELAAAYEKIGDLQAEIFKPNLGNAGGALESHNKALRLRQALFEADANVSRVIDLARSRQKVGSILMITGDISAGTDMYRTAIEQASGLANAGIPARRQLRSLYLSLGQAILRSGSLSDCVHQYLTAFEINEGLLRDDPDRSDPLRAKFIILNYLGYARMLMGEKETALRDLEESLVLAQRLHTEAPSDLRRERQVISAHLFLGVGQREIGRLENALSNLGEALRRQVRIYEMDTKNLGERNGLADCYLELGVAEVKGRQPRLAIRSLRAAMEHYAAVSENDPNDLAVRRQMVLVRRWGAEAESLSGRPEAALATILNARAEAEELVRRDPNNLEWKYDLAMSNLTAARILSAREDRTAAEYRNAAVALLEDLAAASPENVEFTRNLSDARSL
jgi:eukaryotic-like serine/threonine-protein kinase